MFTMLGMIIPVVFHSLLYTIRWDFGITSKEYLRVKKSIIAIPFGLKIIVTLPCMLWQVMLESMDVS